MRCQGAASASTSRTPRAPADLTVSEDRAVVVVGRVGRPHGVRGEMSVDVRTDEPERRYAEGAVLFVEGAPRPSSRTDSPKTVTVVGHRWHSGRLLLQLHDVTDRESAEALRGALLSVEVDPAELPDDPDEYYDHQLVGLAVVDPHGQRIGTVTAVRHGAQDLLVVGRGGKGDDGAGEALVPFVRALVPEVDLRGGRIVIDVPEGLLDLGGSDG
jgi:16S rRNA processing protein RimM